MDGLYECILSLSELSEDTVAILQARFRRGKGIINKILVIQQAILRNMQTTELTGLGKQQ